MLLDALRMLQPDLPGTDALVAKSVCGPNTKCHIGDCPTCQDVIKLEEQLFRSSDNVDPSTPCPYLQWINTQKVNIDATLSTAKLEVMQQLHVMRRHTYVAKIQLHHMRAIKEQLKDGEAVLQEDFSENFHIKQQDEIMSAHWVTNGVTLFAAVLNISKGVKSYGVVSDELHHDKYSVATFNRAILKVASENCVISQLHIFSDGAGSQFKNRFTFKSG